MTTLTGLHPPIIERLVRFVVICSVLSPVRYRILGGKLFLLVSLGQSPRETSKNNFPPSIRYLTSTLTLSVRQKRPYMENM